jgi:hypothetical protein
MGMKIREQALKEMEKLRPGELLKVYDLIHSLRRGASAGKRNGTSRAYLKVRKALRDCKGSLGEDVLSAREDRV